MEFGKQSNLIFLNQARIEHYVKESFLKGELVN